MSTMKPCSGGDCLRTIALPCGAQILYSNRRMDLAIQVDRDEWEKFLAEVKAGHWDDTLLPAPVERRNPPMSSAELRARVAAEEVA